MTTKELTALAKLCQKYGIHELTLDNVHIKIDPHYKQQTTKQAPSLTPEENSLVTPSEEELTYWSSGNTPF